MPYSRKIWNEIGVSYYKKIPLSEAALSQRNTGQFEQKRCQQDRKIQIKLSKCPGCPAGYSHKTRGSHFIALILDSVNLYKRGNEFINISLYLQNSSLNENIQQMVYK